MNAILDGEPTDTQDYLGRQVIIVKTHSGGEDVWLDEKTLFPIFYVLPATPDGMPKRTVQLLALNPAIDIQKPGASCPA